MGKDYPYLKKIDEQAQVATNLCKQVFRANLYII